MASIIWPLRARPAGTASPRPSWGACRPKAKNVRKSSPSRLQSIPCPPKDQPTLSFPARNSNTRSASCCPAGKKAWSKCWKRPKVTVFMKLLITGGAGFIGSNLIHHLIDRPEIERLVNLDCLTYAGHLANLEKISRHPKYVFEKVDLRDKAAVLQVVQRHAISHVMHLAADAPLDRPL